MPLDLDHVRSFFPALTSERVFFENAGGSHACRPVVDRAAAYLGGRMEQLGATHRASAEATARVEAGREAARAWVNAREVEEIVLGPSTTMNMFLMSHALRPFFEPGDEIVVTDLDHEANVGAWRRMARELALTVREWKADPAIHALTLEGLEAALTERTVFVAFTHCSNIVGTLHDARAFIERIHDAGALACVDGVAFAPHRRVDVQALDADLYGLSLYKTYGPHQGLLYVKGEVLDRAVSLNHFFLGPEEGSYRFLPGNVNHELVSALPGLHEYVETVGGDLDGFFAGVAAQEEALSTKLLAFLRGKGEVAILGQPTAEGRVPTIAFTSSRQPSTAIVAATDAAGVAIRNGHMYARRAMDAFGIDPAEGVVRVSMVHYNTLEEVDRLIEVLDRVLE
jgi:cysteine desulfurase family protein (TIGR01976 family)